MSHLPREQRYTIFRMQQAKRTREEICIAICKDKSVLSRELSRNSGKRGYSVSVSAMSYKQREKAPLPLPPKTRLLPPLTSVSPSPVMMLKGVQITLPNGVHVSIEEISGRDMAILIDSL